MQSREADSTGAVAAPAFTEVTVDAADFPTAGGMFRDALLSLPGSPDLLWLDVPCDSNPFDSRGEGAEAGSSWAGGGTAGAAGVGGDPYWRSLVEVIKMKRENEVGEWGGGGGGGLIALLIVRYCSTYIC